MRQCENWCKVRAFLQHRAMLYMPTHTVCVLTTLHIDSLSAVRNRMFVDVGVCAVCGVVWCVSVTMATVIVVEVEKALLIPLKWRDGGEDCDTAAVI